MDTAHQETEAAPVPVTDVDSAAAAISNMLATEEPEDTPDQESEGDETELELAEETNEEAEPAEPAIAPPVSLNAEEKARYAQLPPEAQQFVAELETRRNAQVQQATTKASEAQRAAEARAATADAQAKAVYAQQLSQFADALAPQRPDPQLAATDPMAFIAQNAQYEAAKAQHDEFVQQVQTIKQDAENGVSQAFIQERDRQLMAIPEIQNETTRKDFLDKAFEAANFLGYDHEQVVSKASAQEIAMLRQIAGLKEKADKYDAAMSRQMQRVRQGKSKVMQPRAAQPRAAVQSADLASAKERLKASGSVDDAAAVLRNLGL